MTKSVTLGAIRKHQPCKESWVKLLKHRGKTKSYNGRTKVPLVEILDLLGLDDALWALRALPEEMDGQVRLLVCDLVEPVLQYTDDPRPAQALEVARRYAVGKATVDELDTASAIVWVAVRDAASAIARNATREVSWAVARAAAGAVARAAAWAEEAGDVARWSAASAAASTAAWDAAWVATWAKEAGDVAWNTAKAEQERIFRAWLEVTA
jgi:hypothetical protein